MRKNNIEKKVSWYDRIYSKMLDFNDYLLEQQEALLKKQKETKELYFKVFGYYPK